LQNIYYEIWVDAIVWEKSTNGQRRNWKAFTLIPLSLCQGINLLTLAFWIAPLTKNSFSIFIDFTVFNSKILNSFLSYAVTLLIPFLFFNYFLVLYRDRYESLVKKYKYHKGKLYLWYFLLSIGVFIIPIIIGMILGKI